MSEKSETKNSAGAKNFAAEKQWNGWFRPLAIGKRLGPFVLVPVELESVSIKDYKRKRIIITVPKACGPAVVRNRMRRVLRPLIEAQLKNCSAQKDGSEFFASDLKSQKGIWVRVVKTQRLDSKIIKKMTDGTLQEWANRGANWLCSLDPSTLSTKSSSVR